MAESVRVLPLSFNNADYRTSALRLLFSLFPDWETQEGEIKLTRFTDGITNTLLKAAKLRPGASDVAIDAEAVLIRAYGKGTEILIDREREAASHLLLAERHLAPPLLARFQNGLMYRFIRGTVCTPQDLRQEPVWRGVARRLGQWHAVLPVPESPASTPDQVGKPGPNLWTTLQRWVTALPEEDEAERQRKLDLQQELQSCMARVGPLNGMGHPGFVLAHCDLLSGNVIVRERADDDEEGSPRSPAAAADGPPRAAAAPVSFIDYEYTTPAPAAFDLANHFAEWGGFDCDYGALPTRSVRRAFVREYLRSYAAHLPAGHANGQLANGSASVNGSAHSTAHSTADRAPAQAAADSASAKDRLANDPLAAAGWPEDARVDALCAQVDAFRGVPGLYWGVWAVIQAMISQIDFDYAAYAERRLAEWRAYAHPAAARSDAGRAAALRERRWAQD